MLTMRRPTVRRRIASGIALTLSLVMIAGGLYLLLLVSTPAVIIPVKSIDMASYEAPSYGDMQLIIPKIGVDIAYGSDGEAALDRGAWWRYPDRGEPTTPGGTGNFVIAAHRFTIAPTPQETNVKSPFYHIEKVAVGDKIYVDYEGRRFEYEVSELQTVEPDAIEIEAATKEPRMTLYSCGLGGARSDRLVVIAKPVGEVNYS